ncbi:MAG: acetolactate synthase small subunit [Candidatus Ratteibacteria bacterium]|nr:acetolactate synthase small subunit [Candidatus Ratteibacteria bacterium]
MEHTISVLVENRFGVLARVAGLFSARGFNITSLTVGETEDPSVSRMTIVVEGDDRILEQVSKQLNKLIDIITVQDLTKKGFVERELILVTVKADSKTRPEIEQIAEGNEAKILNAGKDLLTIELLGAGKQVKEFIELLKPFGITELVRSGRIAVGKE